MMHQVKVDLYFFTVVILSVRGRLVRKFMLAAHALGMTEGDYIFLDVEIFQVIHWKNIYLYRSIVKSQINYLPTSKSIVAFRN